MIRATSDKSFTGIKSFEQRLGDQFFRFRLKISHRSDDLTRLEFLEPAAKKGHVIVKRGRQSWKLGSDSQEPTHYKQYQPVVAHSSIRRKAILGLPRWKSDVCVHTLQL
jgi:hypothetical protein